MPKRVRQPGATSAPLDVSERTLTDGPATTPAGTALARRKQAAVRGRKAAQRSVAGRVATVKKKAPGKKAPAKKAPGRKAPARKLR